MTGISPGKNEIVKRLRIHMQDLRARGISHAYLFGSLARDEQTPDSDIDIAIMIDPERQIGLTGLASLQRQLSELLGAKADIVTLPVRKERLRRTLEREAIRAF